ARARELERLADEDEVRLLVLGHKDGRALEVAGLSGLALPCPARAGRSDGRGRERKSDLEARALSGRRVDGDRARHQLGELAGDREAEAGAAVEAVVALVHLVEALEDPALLVLRDPYARVLHEEADAVGVGAGGGREDVE